MKKLFIFGIAAFVVAGCTSVTYQDLNIDDLKTSANLRRNDTLNMNVRQIEKAYYTNRISCGGVNKLMIDPSDPKKAHITFEVMGLTRSNVGLLVEFEENNNKTYLKAYSYAADKWTDYNIEKVLNIISNPNRCQ